MSLYSEMKESIRQDLIDFVGENGVSPELAAHAVDRCAMAMKTKGIMTGGAVAIGVFMGAPIAPVAIAGAAIGGALFSLAKSPKCADVKEAIQFWATEKIMATNEEAKTLWSGWTEAFE